MDGGTSGEGGGGGRLVDRIAGSLRRIELASGWLTDDDEEEDEEEEEEERWCREDEEEEGAAVVFPSPPFKFNELGW